MEESEEKSSWRGAVTVKAELRYEGKYCERVCCNHCVHKWGVGYTCQLFGVELFYDDYDSHKRLFRCDDCLRTTEQTSCAEAL